MNGDKPIPGTVNENSVLLNFIPPDAGIVVEIGCKKGKLGRRYKRRNPVGKYIGIESDAKVAEIASNVLDQVLISDLSSLLSGGGEIDWNSVDCLLVHGHLLDHVVPWEDIQRLINAVSESCILLLTFNNAQYGSYLKRIIQQYAPQGGAGLQVTQNTADFSIARVREICKQTGFTAPEIFGDTRADQNYRQLQNIIHKLSDLNSIDATNLIKQCPPARMIVRVGKCVPERRLLIQSMTLKPIAACNDIRIHGPETMLRSIPGVRTVSSEKSASVGEASAGESRVFIWQRPIMRRPESLRVLRKLHQLGYLIIVDFDDDPRRWQDIVNNDYLSFRGVHGVQTSTDVLADFLRQFNPNVAVFPNQIMELPEEAKRSSDKTVRLFFGALNREADWLPLMPAINRILGEYGQGVHVTVVHDRQFFDALETDNKIFEPMCHYLRYLQLLQDCDIGLLPLGPAEFNRYKSDLKFIEHAACRVVTLASPTVYKDSVRDGETGLLFHNEAEFEEKLRHLIANEEMRSRIIDSAYDWLLRNRLLGQYFRDRYTWYTQLLEQMPRLDEELQQRVPEIFTD